MDDRLKDKVVVVTGGGTGIGLGIVRCCLEAGAAVMIAQRRLEIAEGEAARFREEGHTAQAHRCDVSQREDVAALLDRTESLLGPVDVMINNAALTGRALEPCPFLEETDEHWRGVLNINLTGAFIGTQEAARRMIKRGTGGSHNSGSSGASSGTSGSIINISSVAQYAAQEGAASYCASKAGMDGLTKSAAIELAPYGIRVNGVAPGDIHTEQSASVREVAADRGATGKFFRHTPLNRRGRPEEIGHVAVFLASDEAGFVTGATWLVDGGFLSY